MHHGQFVRVVETTASPERVWKVMTDVLHWPEWTPSVISVAPLDGSAIRVGARFRIVQPKLPSANWRVTEVVPPRTFTWESNAPGVRVVARHIVEPTGAGSRIVLSVDFGGLLGGVWARLTRRTTEHFLSLEAAGHKARSEAGLP